MVIFCQNYSFHIVSSRNKFCPWSLRQLHISRSAKMIKFYLLIYFSGKKERLGDVKDYVYSEHSALLLTRPAWRESDVLSSALGGRDASSEPSGKAQDLTTKTDVVTQLLLAKMSWDDGGDLHGHQPGESVSNVLSNFGQLSNGDKTEFIEMLLERNLLGPDQKWHLQQKLPEFLFRDFFTLLPDEVLEVST